MMDFKTRSELLIIMLLLLGCKSNDSYQENRNLIEQDVSGTRVEFVTLDLSNSFNATMEGSNILDSFMERDDIGDYKIILKEGEPYDGEGHPYIGVVFNDDTIVRKSNTQVMQFFECREGRPIYLEEDIDNRWYGYHATRVPNMFIECYFNSEGIFANIYAKPSEQTYTISDRIDLFGFMKENRSFPENSIKVSVYDSSDKSVETEVKELRQFIFTENTSYVCNEEDQSLDCMHKLARVDIVVEVKSIEVSN